MITFVYKCFNCCTMFSFSLFLSNIFIPSRPTCKNTTSQHIYRTPPRKSHPPKHYWPPNYYFQSSPYPPAGPGMMMSPPGQYAPAQPYGAYPPPVMVQPGAPGMAPGQPQQQQQQGGEFVRWLSYHFELCPFLDQVAYAELTHLIELFEEVIRVAKSNFDELSCW